MKEFQCISDTLTDGKRQCYMIGIYAEDIKDIITDAVKLSFGKTGHLTFNCGGKDRLRFTVSRGKTVIEIGGNRFSVDKNAEEALMSFLIDSTEEYPAYDHIDLTLSGIEKQADIDISLYTVRK